MFVNLRKPMYFADLCALVSKSRSLEQTQRTRIRENQHVCVRKYCTCVFVCVAGCGNGKYLSVNPSIYKLGADRCNKLAEAAREKENEVRLIVDLALLSRII